MVFFAADLHFGHEKIIQMAHRPFADSAEMDNSLIKNWNNRVKPNDEVYLLGDITLKGSEYATKILTRLNGRKFLIRGNHDQFADKALFDSSLFEWVKDYYQLNYQGQRMILFHYPIAEWNQFYRGSIHLHGHQHNSPSYNLANAQNRLLRYDVGVDANGMSPVSIDEILNFFSMSKTK